MTFEAFTEPLKRLADCDLCPRNCHADRLTGRPGVCGAGAGFGIASICIHRGEEPAISGPSGICNIFFTGCNLRCIYCQNHQISDNRVSHANQEMELEAVITAITAILDRGINQVGFVSPSHFVPQVQVIIRCIESLGYRPVWVYNTNGYDKPETLRMLEGTIDVYLPDFKYMDPELAKEFSGARDYPEVAMKALLEMKRQKGTVLHTDDEGFATSGIIVRHLVLPGYAENSLAVLRFLAEEISPKIHISLMSQYYPTERVASHPKLGRCLTEAEYRRVRDEMERLNLNNGWVQEFDSNAFYRPDFSQPAHPFE